MGRDLQSDAFCSTCHENNWSASLSLALQALQHRLAVWPIRGLAPRSPGDLKLQTRLALCQPIDHRKQQKGIAQENNCRTFPQGIC